MKTKTTHHRRSLPKQMNSTCPIVGVGGSAGGFEAAMDLLGHLSTKTGMAFVIVQHLDPRHASRLAILLAKATLMRVTEITGSVKPEPNNVYVQPANKCVVCKDGRLTLVRRTGKVNVAIDHFFESLAEEQGPRAIGVLLSGTGSDGTSGLHAIKTAGGITFAQDEESAKYSAMPRNAIHSGSVDAALSPKEIAAELLRVSGHPYISEATTEGNVEARDLARVFLTLKKHTGIDFTGYRQTTLRRRIERRMVLHRMEHLSDYVNLLRDKKTEVHELFNDLLINVTRFFRDKHVFQTLNKRFFPALLKQKGGKGALRVWVPGCATGEEVYSLAICILETIRNSAPQIRIQIFGTDLSEAAIERARLGVYSSAIEKDVSPTRLKRFFKKLDGTYRINRMVRDLCTFARQNIAADPPFSKLDLISCRNVLIYLGPLLQKRAMPVFHYALNPEGFLLLGPSETVGTFSDLFELIDRRTKLFAKKILPGRLDVDFRPYAGTELKDVEGPRLSPPTEGRDFTSQVQRIADRIMLGSYAPTGVVIDENMLVRHFRGHASAYLEHAAGPATLNLLHMARTSLVPDLRVAIHRAFKTKQPTRKERAMMKRDGALTLVNIEVVPFKVPDFDGTWALVVFNEVGKATASQSRGKRKRPRKTMDDEMADQLRDELNATKESLQAIIEEQEATNEELTSANEEIESSNEELQSTNEELETAKEELQSTNEELTTLNEELNNRNLEIMQVNSDLQNLLGSIHLPIVMVDNELTVRRVTPMARAVFNISEADLGRRITELTPNIEVPNLEKILREVIDTLNSHEREVLDRRGHSYSLRIRPYRAANNKIDGAVITLVDIDHRDRATQKKNER